MKLGILLGLGMAILCGKVWAQGCPAGIPSAGNPACIPPDRENSPYYQGHGGSNQASVPRMIWADRWGAIALDMTITGNGGVGTIVGMQSKRKAERAAMEKCRNTGGGSGCKISLSYYNQCAAVAWGENDAISVGAATIEEASEVAKEKCNRYTTDCQIYYAECSMAERIQ